jgi:hypothetical protein
MPPITIYETAKLVIVILIHVIFPAFKRQMPPDVGMFPLPDNKMEQTEVIYKYLF